ncbi:MAG: hypothetical protein IJ213_01870 [Bacteroidales bacterium]|nr:hypothetical protein [Bacteroidales bacterium]
MKYHLFILLFFLPFLLNAQQENKSTENESIFLGEVPDISMIDALYLDYINDTTHRKEKRECYIRYSQLFLQTLYSQISSPIGYIFYYLNRKKITSKIQDFYKQNNLSNIENIGNDIIEGNVIVDSLKSFLGSTFYNLWLYGDTKNPVENGGVPTDYKPNKSMFARRFSYSALRNPRWNSTYVNNYSNYITFCKTAYDSRNEINTSNYGTRDTRLGVWLRWFVDKDGKYWFFYENTKQKSANKGKLFYFGVVGLGSIEDGQQKDIQKKGRFEFSLNRTVKINR